MYYHAVLNHEFKLEWSNIDKWPIKSDINNTYTCIRRIRQKLVFRNITVLLPLGLDYSLNNINTIYIPDTESSFVIAIVVSFIYDTILHCHVLLNNSELILKGVVINWIVILGYFIAIVFIL